MNKLLLTSISLVLFLCNCRESNLKVIEYSTYGQFGLNNLSDTIKNHVKIVFIDSIKIFIMPHENIQITETGYKSSETNLYAVFVNNKTSGLMFNLSENKIGKVVSLDSTLMQNNLGEHDNMIMFSKDFGKPNLEMSDGHNKLLFKYVLKNSFQYPDSVYRYFDSELNDIPFSLSTIYDNETSKKFYRMDIVIAPRVTFKNGKSQSTPKSLQTFKWKRSSLTKDEKADLELIKKSFH